MAPGDMEHEGEMKNDAPVESPTSVLEDEDVSKEEIGVKLEEEILLDAKNGDFSPVSRVMAEEEKLLESRVKEERENYPTEAPCLNDTQFTKLDELLTQTQLYSKFILEKMNDITVNNVEEDAETVKGKQGGHGSKRKAATNYNDRKAKRAVAAMLTRSKEGTDPEDISLTEEEKTEKEQAELVPLLTGGKLKSYQLKGVKWLISLWQNGLNGILADQMGLGKTIQTIGFLAHLKGKGLDGPYLIIAPLSKLSNWVNEISRFTPSVNSIIYHGNDKERDEIRRKFMPRATTPKFPIVVTSYEVALCDALKHLRHYDWKYIVVDEGHRLKNSQCKLVKELKRLPVENKLLLTGTPLHNNLAELWSLLNFILPDIFQSHEEFESWFDLSGKCSNEATKEEIEENRKVVAKLHAIVRPFLLRRMKSDVDTSYVCNATSAANKEEAIQDMIMVGTGYVSTSVISLDSNSRILSEVATPQVSTSVNPNVEEFKKEVEAFYTRILSPIHPTPMDKLKLATTSISLSQLDKDTLSAFLRKFLRMGIQGLIKQQLVPHFNQCTQIFSSMQISKPEVREQIMIHLVAFESHVADFERIANEGASKSCSVNNNFSSLEDKARELIQTHLQKTLSLQELRVRETKLKAELALVSQTIEKATTEIIDLETQASKNYQEIENLKVAVRNQEKFEFFCQWADKTLQHLCNLFSDI